MESGRYLYGPVTPESAHDQFWEESTESTFHNILEQAWYLADRTQESPMVPGV